MLKRSVHTTTTRVYRAPVYAQKIVLSDGATYTKYTTSPKSHLRLTKDIRNTPLWNPGAGKQMGQEETGRLARFRGRFGAEFTEEDNDSWLVSEQARAAPKVSDRELKEAQRKKPAKGKK